jgi:hypothetical protein
VEHAAHLDQGPHGIGEMLQHLVGVDHVERRGGRRYGVGGADGEVDVAAPSSSRLGRGFLDHVFGPVDADDGARRDTSGEVDRDRAGAATDVEHPLTGAQVGQEVRGRVLGCPPSVAAEDRLVMTVCVSLVHATDGGADEHDGARAGPAVADHEVHHSGSRAKACVTA